MDHPSIRYFPYREHEESIPNEHDLVSFIVLRFLNKSSSSIHRINVCDRTCGAESISRITVIEEFISDHVLLVIRLGKWFNEFVAIFDITLDKTFMNLLR